MWLEFGDTKRERKTNLSGRLHLWPPLFTSSCIHTFTCDFAVLPTKWMMHISLTLDVIFAMWLLWPIERDRSDSVHVLSLGLRRTCMFPLIVWRFCYQHERNMYQAAWWSQENGRHIEENHLHWAQPRSA